MALPAGGGGVTGLHVKRTLRSQLARQLTDQFMVCVHFVVTVHMCVCRMWYDVCCVVQIFGI